MTRPVMAALVSALALTISVSAAAPFEVQVKELRAPDDTVLDPSFGAGVFLHAACRPPHCIDAVTSLVRRASPSRRERRAY